MTLQDLLNKRYDVCGVITVFPDSRCITITPNPLKTENTNVYRVSFGCFSDGTIATLLSDYDVVRRNTGGS